ncbi:Sec7 domain protein [Mycena chlorophos]|uniref:Sec7 domain protein n=1 Tax=Mycena chlorophos TaxID=658473 RepID=A0A8H6T4E6_MYCCL|nr:Sec7 domain protein [Mycena chlorophos]
MGRFSLGSSHQDAPLPPTYQEASSSSPAVLVSQTTTTQVTHTVFSLPLPLWRKRSQLRVEKDLPPTPPDDDEGDETGPVFVAPKAAIGSSSAALAHASLGLGLPHAADMNTIVFAAGPSEARQLRRVKSSALRATSVYEPGPANESPKPRTRGISLTESKAKQEEQPQPKVSLARRASFWSRRKSAALEVHAPDRDEIPVPPPSLPSMLPLTPFTIDDLSPPRHGKGLSRSHSARAGPGSAAEASPQPRSRRSTRRPATADSSTRSPMLKPPTPPPPLPPTPITPASRPRAQTNPPLLYRLSMNLFSSSSSSPSPSLAHPPPLIHDSPLNSPSISASNSPRPSLQRPTSVIPKPEIDHESPEIYLNRLLLTVSKAEVAGVLAASADPFHTRALRAYIGNFDFAGDPLDIALRKLLMHVGLPRETQQIDRVMEAFAGRYLECNPNLFASDDHPYILAFSLIMLHTDAFNKSNKRKMTKVDYVKNTRLPGVPPEVLDCFYDNIVVTPFIFVEDPLDVDGQRAAAVTPTRTLSFGNPLASSTSSSGSLLGKTNKLDVYYLIANNLLDPLRVDVDSLVPRENPFSFTGTAGPWSESELRVAFTHPASIEIPAANPRVSTFSVSPNGPVALTPNSTNFPDIAQLSSILSVTKVGYLNKKDDLLEGGKKSANRKWRPWSVILSGSQLHFFRDPALASTIAFQLQDADGVVALPHPIAAPEERLAVHDLVAVHDRSYKKHEFVFRLVLANGRQSLLQAEDEDQLNEWVARINYASAFKTTGVRMRPAAMSNRDVQLTGVAAATSHLHDLQHAQTAAHRSRKWDHEASRDLMEMLSGEPASPIRRSAPQRRGTATSVAETDVPTAPEIDGADQFKATFDQVKAELAAGYPAVPAAPAVPLATSPLPSRAHIIGSKVRELDSKISTVQSQLDSDLRFVRNIGTLTPFQRATRERLTAAVQTAAKRIMHLRLEMAKLSCHREVLSNDLTAESIDWTQAKKIALQAAAETLQIRGDEHLPRTVVTFPESSGSTGERKRSSSSHRPDSTADSFHSALDFSEDTMSSFLSTSPRRDNSSQSSMTSVHETTPALARRASLAASDGPDTPSHEKFYTALENPEPAEDWNQTRLGQRVSLVRVPSTIRISSRFQMPQDS